MTELEQIRQRIRSFRDARDWMQFHNAKNLACSVSIEAAELLQHFQWATSEQSEQIAEEKLEAISHEIADVAIYLLELAENLGIDLADAIHRKLDLNEVRYPVEKAKGSSRKYDEL